MSIRVPPKADPDTRNAFTDIEQELNELKSSVISIEETPAVSLASLQEQIELLNSKVNELSQFQDVSESFGTKTDGLPLRALHEDGNWREVIDGLVKAVPAELGGASKAQRVVNVLASLAVLNGLSADSVRCRKLWAPRPACHIYRSAAQTIANNTNTDVLWTNQWFDNSGMHSTDVNTDRITVPEDGIYLAGIHFLWESNTTGDRQSTITLNDPAPSDNSARLCNFQRDATSDQFARMSGCVLVSLAAGDVLRAQLWHDRGANVEILDVTTYGPRANGFWCVKVSD